MAFNQIIKSTLSPNIQLSELSAADNSIDSEGGLFRANESNKSIKQIAGSDAPYIKINGTEIARKNIDQFILDETGFIPKATLIFEDTLGIFSGDAFPKTDLILSVYIKTQNPNFKPIRCDFLIMNVKSLNSNIGNDPSSQDTTYIVSGELFIPKIYYNIAKSYRKLSSKNTLLEVAKELGLGFAENECNPSDSMTWINYNLNYIDFCEHVIAHAYQDDDSFFTSFIDKYYHLNYLNVNQQLLPGDIQKTLVNSEDSSKLEPTQEIAKNIDNSVFDTEVPLYLSTDPANKGHSNYIMEYRLISDQGKVLKKSGYKKRIYYYDHLLEKNSPKDKFTSFYVNPISKNGESDSSELPLIPDNEYLKNTEIKKWLNIDYGNSHSEWNAARLINNHNLTELTKIQLFAKVKGINFQLVRGAKIPLEILITQEEYAFKYKTKNKSDGKEPTINIKAGHKVFQLDDILSGSYYVSGIKYIYDRLHNPKFYTEYYLARREWQLTKKDETTNA